MLLRHRSPGIDPRPVHAAQGLDHLSADSVAVLRWLRERKVEFVLVGAVAEAVRGRTDARGPVAIVPAPYSRNLERLARALWSAHARLRVDTEVGTVPIKVTEEKLAAGERMRLRCGAHDLDVEGRPAGAPGYQELLYEATRTVVEPGLAIEVASPEDLEHYAQLRATGRSPQIRISRTGRGAPVDDRQA